MIVAALSLALLGVSASAELPTQVNGANQLRGLRNAPGASLSVPQRCLDPVVERVGATRLRVGRNWSSASPCGFRWGERLVVFTQPFFVDGVALPTTGTLRVAAGRDVLHVRIEGAPEAAVTVTGAPLPVEVQSGATFPVTGVPVFQWEIRTGEFALTGTPLLTPYSQVELKVGWGTILVTSGSRAQTYVDTAYVGYLGNPPEHSGECREGTGAWAMDSRYLYFCVLNEKLTGFRWARASLTAWGGETRVPSR